MMESAVSSKQGLNQYVFARHQVDGREGGCKRITVRPATTDSHTHKRLRDAIEKKHGARAKGPYGSCRTSIRKRRTRRIDC